MWKTLFCFAFAVHALGFVPASSAGDVDPNLVGWWKFDDGSGGVAADSSGLENHGTLVSNPAWSVGGARGGYLYFDGSDAHVRIPHDDSLNPGTGSFTFLFWANVDPVPGTRGDGNWDLVTNKRDTGSAGYYIGAYRAQGGADEAGYRFMLGDTDANRKDTPFATVPMDEWVFVAAVLDRDQDVQKISVDGGQTWATNSPPPGAIAPVQDFAIAFDIGPANYWFHGGIDDVAMFSRALSEDEIRLIRDEGMIPELAKGPQPADHAVDVPRDVVLSWDAGLNAVTHDVYFGTSEAEVEQADRANPMGTLISQDRAETTYDLGRLALDQTYYWRVDEFGASADGTILKGDVWSFTIEPSGYELPGSHIVATASSSSTAEEGPANTIDGVGLDADDLHSTDMNTMWLTAAVPPGQSAWIQYEFDKVYALHQMLVWNYNTATEPLVGFGIKEALVEYSTDGSNWVSLDDAPEFARAAGLEGLAAATVVDFAGAAARYVRITAMSNWGGLLPQYGLSEVRFLYVPLAAREPQPASGATDVAPEFTPDWRPGREAATHEVYVSTDEQAVVDRTAPAVTASAPGSETFMLELDRTYYWAVDEVNETEVVGTWPGDVWTLSTLEYFVVDDFESYSDEEGNEVFGAWLDGFEDAENGSQVGHMESQNGTYGETGIVRSGGQSMPLAYDNTAPVARSEAVLTLGAPQDWTAHGVSTLTVHFRGDLGNTGQLYLKINDTKVAYDGPADLATLLWQVWNVDLSSVAADLSNVTSLTIGIEGANATGTLYVDDIRLNREAPEVIQPMAPDAGNLVAHFALDGDPTDSSGNGYNGEAIGDPTYVSGVRAQAIELDGVDDFVRIPDQDALNPGDGNYSWTFWVRLDPTPSATGSATWDLAVNKRETGSNGMYIGANRGQGNDSQAGFKFMLGDTSGSRVDTGYGLVPLDEWVFVAAVLDRDQNVHKVSVDGGYTWSTATPPAGPIAPAQDLGLGFDIGPNNFWLHGAMDEVRLYKAALSEAEIAWLAAN